MNKLRFLFNELIKISPLPTDEELTEEILDKYQLLLESLMKFNDISIIEPLINSFGYGYAYGLYYMTRSILEEFEADVLEVHLLNSLVNGELGQKMWSAHLLGRCNSKNAIPILENLSNSEHSLLVKEAKSALERISG